MSKLFTIAIITNIILCMDHGTSGLQCNKCLRNSADACDKSVQVQMCKEGQNFCQVYNGWITIGGFDAKDPTFSRACSSTPCEKVFKTLKGEEDKDKHCSVCQDDNCNSPQAEPFEPIPETIPSK